MNAFCPHCGARRMGSALERCTACGGAPPEAPATHVAPGAAHFAPPDQGAGPTPAYGPPPGFGAPAQFGAPQAYGPPAGFGAPPGHGAPPGFAPPFGATPPPIGQTPPFGGDQPPYAPPGAWPAAPSNVRPPSSALPQVAMAGAALVVLATGFVAFRFARSSISRLGAGATASGESSEPPGHSSADDAGTSSGASTATAAPQGPPADAVASGPVSVAWGGRVKSSTDFSLRAGAPCTLRATLSRSTTGKRGPRQDSLVFQCGTKVLYDSSQPLGSGVSNSSLSVGELPLAGELDAFQYTLKAQDVGTRTGERNQLAASTRDGIVEVYRDLPSFRVKATIDKRSAVRRGKPLLDDSVPRFSHLVTKTAVVDKRTGRAPFFAPQCSLVLSPAYATKHTCRVLLTCAGKVVIGSESNGYEDCGFDASGEPTGFDDPQPTPKDSDPAMRVDLAAGTAEISDQTPAGAYSVSFKLR